MGRIEILHCSGLAAAPRVAGCDRLGWRPAAVSPPRFRTIQVCPKDFPAMLRQSDGAAPAHFVGGVTMSERAIDERQGWDSDIVGVGPGSRSIQSCFSR
jgi:hypothetical protein